MSLILRFPARFALLFGTASGVIAPVDAQTVRSEPEKFAIEASGAAAGSLITAALAYQIANKTRGECNVDDLGCLLGRIGVMGSASIVGATAGGLLAGRAADTRPSAVGSVLGAVIGVATGAGVIKLLEEANVRSEPVVIVSYGIAQGITTALFSRALSRR
jgi:hypothetical protein